ncbi:MULTISPECIES: DUF2180 family protein [unclassified Streptomyces]|uniref:DUF2180 family protein n=1 Tax=unclassified Streptomyces TaxID=2593676 RepID=UPI000996B655|nr:MULTISPECIES: DUF2180 family protein [unclassified Streptomyces]MYQ75825.1 DUF2180 family protein [Streptomyces sp. SID4923]NEC06187.1 DUF2180 family protein [Streptomyces sp. SID7909]
MNCYDCHTSDVSTPALAVCRRCGAGICGAHSTAVPHTLHRINGVGVATLPRVARRLVCPTCCAAEQSA